MFGVAVFLERVALLLIIAFGVLMISAGGAATATFTSASNADEAAWGGVTDIMDLREGLSERCLEYGCFERPGVEFARGTLARVEPDLQEHEDMKVVYILDLYTKASSKHRPSILNAEI